MKTMTKEQILDRNGFDFEAFKFENEYSAKNILLAMDEYSEQNCDVIHDLFNRPARVLDQLHAVYRKDNPRPDGVFYTPDRTEFYKWIVMKVLKGESYTRVV